jgi:hypothetical protein
LMLCDDEIVLLFKIILNKFVELKFLCIFAA